MKKNYSKYLKISYLITDLLILNLSIYLIKDKEYLNFRFIVYSTLFWMVLSLFTKFYKIHRRVSFFKTIRLLFIQFFLFILSFFTYFAVFREGYVIGNQFLILISIIIVVTIVKFFSLFIVNKYGNLIYSYTNAIVVGFDDSSKKVIKTLRSKANLGYYFLGFFSKKVEKSNHYLGNLEDCFGYLMKNKVDEIYASLSSLSREEIKKINKFTLGREITLKLIPNTDELYSKSQTVEYYEDDLVILNVDKLPFAFTENFYIKRIFDIVFSMLVCLLILSWLIPILWILIKIESRGPLIFKQSREGLNGKEFICYKFRSMKINKEANRLHVSKGDSRITKIGAFLRKTSMDELPQFINVLKGNMSVVGPRPHMKYQSKGFEKEIKSYARRTIVKPGITGLAQIKGYRGEVIEKLDITNRIRMDIFYIENWTFWLDIKIIIQTVLKVFKGDEKAY